MVHRLVILLVSSVIYSSLFAQEFESQGFRFSVNDDNSTCTLLGPGDEKPTGALKIPSTVSDGTTSFTVNTIAERAFDECMNLTAIEIPASITKIENNAFLWCYALEEVTIADSPTPITLGSNTNSILPGLFSEASVKKLYLGRNIVATSRPFRNRRELAELTIGPQVTSLAEYEFYECSELINIVSNAANPPKIVEHTFDPQSYANAIVKVAAYSVYSYKLSDWRLFTHLVALGSTNSLYVYVTRPGNIDVAVDAAIGEDSPANKTSLIVAGTINSFDLKYINENFKNLTSIDLSAVEIISSTLEYYKDSNGVGYRTTDNVIGSYWAYGLPLLQSITLPKGITRINDKAFYDKKHLKSIVIPDNVEVIGDNAFARCTSLASVQLGKGLETIGASAFDDCYALKSITIPSRVTTIPDYLFQNCTALTEVTFQGRATEIIGREAFFGCTSLRQMSLPSTLSTIGSSAFEQCTKLESITIPRTLAKISQRAFAKCSSLKSVTIPSTVNEIEMEAFASCQSLEEIIFEESTRTLKLGRDLFSGTNSLATLQLNRMVDFGGNQSPFSNQSKLTTVTFGPMVTSLNRSMFERCTALTSVTIPESITKIEDYAFYNCSNLST